MNDDKNGLMPNMQAEDVAKIIAHALDQSEKRRRIIQKMRELALSNDGSHWEAYLEESYDDFEDEDLLDYYLEEAREFSEQYG